MSPASCPCYYGYYGWPPPWEDISRWYFDLMPPPLTSPGSTSCSARVHGLAVSAPATPTGRSRRPRAPVSITLSEVSTCTRGFSDSVKSKVEKLYGSKICWACGALDADCAHVIAVEDSQREKWQQADLIKPEISSGDNLVFLCPTCHRQYDKTIDAGFVFFPADLQYFIDYEERDAIRRGRLPEGDPNARRVVPTMEEYKAYQVRQGHIHPDAIGGLYRPVFLHEYQHVDLDEPLRRSILQKYSVPKPWHGNPIATIRRAMVVLGTAQIAILEPMIRKQLQYLLELYMVNDSQEYIHPFLKDLHGPTSGESKRRDPDRDDDDNTSERYRGSEVDGPSPTKKLKRLSEDRGPADDLGRLQARQLPSPSQSADCRDWLLGPKSTSEDAVRKFSLLFSSA